MCIEQKLIYDLLPGKNEKIFSIEQINRGRNNIVLKIVTNQNTYGLKKYISKDASERFEREKSAYFLLHEMDFSFVASLIGIDKSNYIILTQWVEGNVIHDIDVDIVKKFCDFHLKLDSYFTSSSHLFFHEAKDACLSESSLLVQIKQRLVSFENIYEDDPLLLNFFKEYFYPIWNKIIEKPYKTAIVPLSNQTLILSDFGIHNAVKKDNSIYFFDFEYFGRDDPVTGICNFVLHPTMNLNEENRKLFVSTFLNHHEKRDVEIRDRYAKKFPLYALRWCLIVLNEFLPHKWEERRKAHIFSESYAEIKNMQLEKAKNILKKITADKDV